MLPDEHLDKNQSQVSRITHADLNTTERMPQLDAPVFLNTQAASGTQLVSLRAKAILEMTHTRKYFYGIQG